MVIFILCTRVKTTLFFSLWGYQSNRNLYIKEYNAPGTKIVFPNLSFIFTTDDNLIEIFSIYNNFYGN